MKAKRLERPTFKFIHDCVTSVVETRGFASGLFNDQERDSEWAGSVRRQQVCWGELHCDCACLSQSKENKVAFLEKIIDCVGIALKYVLVCISCSSYVVTLPCCVALK